MYESIPPFAMLKAFEAVGRAGGVRRAAKDLQVDHGIVSRHLRSLETLLGTSLVNRQGSDFTLSADGLSYHAAVTLAFRQIADATDSFRQRNEQAIILWCAPGFAYYWLRRRLSEFRMAYPNVDIQLRPSDSFPDFISNEADAYIRYMQEDHITEDDRLEYSKVATPPVFPVASPDYIRIKNVQITQAADYLRYDLIHESSDDEWRAWLHAQGLECGALLPGPRLWHAHVALDAARTGQGLALANPMLVSDDMASGRLEMLLPTGLSPVPIGSYMFVARKDRWDLPRLVQFRMWLCSAIPQGS